MRQLNIRVQTENLDTSQELVEIFKSRLVRFIDENPRYQSYQLNLIPQEKYQFDQSHRSTTTPYYLQLPAFDLKISYSFANSRASKNLEDFNELESFAQWYAQFIRDCLSSSTEHMGRVSESGFRTIQKHQEEINQWMQREKEQWRNQHSHLIAHTPIFLRTCDYNYHQRKARVNFGTAIALSLISIPIFFIEPITASVLLLAAILFCVAGLCEKAQANQSEVAIII